MGQVTRHPLDRVGVDVGRRHLDGGRQVDDDLALGRGLEHLDHLIAHVDSEFELGARVALGRVLVVDGRAGDRRLHGATLSRTVQGDVDDALLVGAEHDLTLQDARRVVEVHDGLLGARDGLVGALDEVVACLRQHLDGDVVGDRALVDEAAHEVEVGLARRREPDLDLFVAHAHEQVEHDALAFGAHRVDEGLVAVAQVDGAPARRLLDALRGPRAIGQVDADQFVERAVPVNGHRRGLLGVLHEVLFSLVRMSFSRRRTPQRGRPGLGLAAAAKEKQAVKHGSRLTPRALGRANVTSERMSPPGHPLARRLSPHRRSGGLLDRERDHRRYPHRAPCRGDRCDDREQGRGDEQSTEERPRNARCNERRRALRTAEQRLRARPAVPESEHDARERWPRA